jgi:hypothetical protein
MIFVNAKPPFGCIADIATITLLVKKYRRYFRAKVAFDTWKNAVLGEAGQNSMK